MPGPGRLPAGIAPAPCRAGSCHRCALGRAEEARVASTPHPSAAGDAGLAATERERADTVQHVDGDARGLVLIHPGATRRAR